MHYQYCFKHSHLYSIFKNISGSAFKCVVYNIQVYKIYCDFVILSLWQFLLLWCKSKYTAHKPSFTLYALSSRIFCKGGREYMDIFMQNFLLFIFFIFPYTDTVGYSRNGLGIGQQTTHLLSVILFWFIYWLIAALCRPPLYPVYYILYYCTVLQCLFRGFVVVL